MSWDKVIDHAYIEAQTAWGRETFGPGPRTLGVLDHIRKELDEVAAEPDDLSEWADLIILAIDGASRRGHSGQAIIDAVHAKFEKNQMRKWPDWRGLPEDKAIEHVREERVHSCNTPFGPTCWCEQKGCGGSGSCAIGIRDTQCPNPICKEPA